MTEYKIHRMASIFPRMKKKEFEELKNDIYIQGQLEPIYLLGDEIIDGRHRYMACVELNVEPIVQSFEELGITDPIAFIVSKNQIRRHLTVSQRAMIGAKLKTEFAKLTKEAHRNSQRLLAEAKHSGKEGFTKGALNGSNLTSSMKSTAKAIAEKLDVSASSVKSAIYVNENDPKVAEDVIEGKISVNAAKKKVQEKVKKRKEPKRTEYILLDDWNGQSLADRNKTSKLNKQSTNSIEWSRWSWNPVSGCKHTCSYCYARDFAKRIYKQGFEPSIYPERLSAPYNTNVPDKASEDVSYKNIFTCSMADLFGRWVPEEWIKAVLKVVSENPQWNFLFLTKFPSRMAEFDIPDNAWMGTTVDLQARVKPAEKAFKKVNCKVKWLSVEPMLDNLEFSNLELFDWIAIGGSSSSNNTPAFAPPFDWIVNLHNQARKARCMIYHKTNLMTGTNNTSLKNRLREWPGVKSKEFVLPDVFRYLK